MEMTAFLRYIWTAAQPFGSQDYYNESLMMILGLAGVLFCENKQIRMSPKKFLCLINFCKLKTTEFTRCVFMFSESSHFILKFGIK